MTLMEVWQQAIGDIKAVQSRCSIVAMECKATPLWMQVPESIGQGTIFAQALHDRCGPLINMATLLSYCLAPATALLLLPLLLL
jgi:hypothetical protein